jgi:hypothetical protein
MKRLLIKDIKAGDIFVEYDYGMSVACTALEDARRVDDTWVCRAMVGDSVVEYMTADGGAAYHPDLWLLQDNPMVNNNDTVTSGEGSAGRADGEV